MKLDKIEIDSKYKHILVREIDDSGGYHRRVLYCGVTLVDDEHQEIKDMAEELWTNEVKTVWTTRLAELDAEQ